MKHAKQLISFVLIFVLLSTMALTAFAAHPFDDVEEDSWYSNSVDYVYNKSLMSGTSSTSFSPDTNMSRAMLVTVLYSMAGKPTVNTTEPFSDVASSDWFYKPVVWAYGNGIVAGTSANFFSPNSNVTREQMVTIFAKYAVYKGLKTSAYTNLNRYSDSRSISSYAVDSFKWAVGAGIISGTSTTTLEPQGYATRAQCAVIIRQFVRWTDENGVVVTPTPIPTPVPTPMPTPDINADRTPDDEL